LRTWREEAETANTEPLLARRENYSADALPYRILYLTAGVDVQDDRFEIEVVGWRQVSRKDPEESWGVVDEVIYGDLGKGEIWLELDECLKREFTTEDGCRLRLGAVRIDSGGHHTQEVNRFWNMRLGRHVYAIKGVDGAADMAAPRRQEQESSGEQCVDDRRRYRQGRHLFQAQSDHAGAGLLPFPDHLSAGIFQPVDERGGPHPLRSRPPVRYWFKPSGKRNDALDRRVYALAALHARPVPWEVLLRAAPTEPPPRSPSPPEAHPIQDEMTETVSCREGLVIARGFCGY
jgi:phage terminase large subunit GpA-like protein